ncbi:MAG TPA: PIN domain-containing protein [Candidatus Saccharimonadia bacterium]|nr:PIN domain-containing protein [Candidatus Saccharimonadia bacterium]
MAKLAGSVDANVLLRLILNDVADQHKAAVELFQYAPGQFAVADVAVIELAFVLARHYGFTREQIREAIDGVMALAEVNCNRLLFEKVLPLFVKHPKLSFEDCCLVVYAELNETEPLWTFDQKLASQTPGAQLVTAAKN